MLRLLFCLLLAKVEIVICLVFRVGGCAMVICLAFCDYELLFLWLATVNHMCDYDWFAFHHAIVIRPICLALRDNNLLAIFICFLYCNCNSPILSSRIVIRLFLRDDDLLALHFTS